MKTVAELNIVSNDFDTDGFKVYLRENGQKPSIILEEGQSIDNQIYVFLDSLFYNKRNIVSSMNLYKLLSNFRIHGSTCIVTYNIFCYDEPDVKEGKFVKFNKNSIELYRFANNKRK